MAIIVTEFDGVEKGCIEQEFVATPVTLEPMDSDEITLNSEEITDINNQVVAQVHQLESLNVFELGEINKAFEALLVTESLYNEDLTQYQKEKRLASLESLDFSLPSMESNEEKEKGILTRIWEWIKNAFESFKKRMLKVGQWIKIQVKKMVRAIRGKNKFIMSKLSSLKSNGDDTVTFKLNHTLRSKAFFVKPLKEAGDLVDCLGLQAKSMSNLIDYNTQLKYHYSDCFRSLKLDTEDKILTKEEIVALIDKELSKVPDQFKDGGIKVEDGKEVNRDENGKLCYKEVPPTTVNEDQEFEMPVIDLLTLSKLVNFSIDKFSKELDDLDRQFDRSMANMINEFDTTEKFMKDFLKARKETMKDRNVGFTVDQEAVNHDRLVIKTRLTLIQELINVINTAMNNDNIYLLTPVVKYINALNGLADMIIKLINMIAKDTAKADK